MPEPLDYRNPKASSARRLPTARAAIPIEFDTLLTDTDDHAATRAIEVQLHRSKIAFHCSQDGQRVARKQMLYVAKTDFDVAVQIAAGIFVRRRKIKSFPRPEMPDTGRDRSDWIDPNF